MFVYVWEYRVREDSVEEFIAHYSADGSWVELFRRAPGYIATQLLRDRSEPDRFLSVDTWESADRLADFRRESRAEFEALDRRCEELTESEVFLGNFERFDRVEGAG